MLGRRIISDKSNYTVVKDLCRCNGGSNYGLDVKSTYCNKFSFLYQRTTDVGYYTPSPRWHNANQEYDYYAMEVKTLTMQTLQLDKNKTWNALLSFPDSEKHTVEYTAVEDQYELLSRQVDAYSGIIREFACALVYPRCARCDDIVEDPTHFFGGNAEVRTKSGLKSQCI